LSVRSARYNLLSLRNPKGLTVIPEERDAWAFLDAAGIKSSREQRAVIELVRGLKHAQLWTKMKAIYPFVGGTATTHKFNLKDPRDADAAFRLSFSGGWTHSSTGALGSSNAYANTYFNGNTSFTNNDTHISYYCRTNSDGNYIDMGMYRPTSPSTAYDISIRLLNNYYYDAYSLSNRISGANSTTSQGHYINARTSSTAHTVYKNGAVLKSSSTTSVTNTSNLTIALFINALNDNGSAQYYTNRQCAFATIGDGLTDTDATALYNIVQRFQTSLGRQV